MFFSQTKIFREKCKLTPNFSYNSFLLLSDAFNEGIFKLLTGDSTIDRLLSFAILLEKLSSLLHLAVNPRDRLEDVIFMLAEKSTVRTQFLFISQAKNLYFFAMCAAELSISN